MVRAASRGTLWRGQRDCVATAMRRAQSHDILGPVTKPWRCRNRRMWVQPLEKQAAAGALRQWDTREQAYSWLEMTTMERGNPL